MDTCAYGVEIDPEHGPEITHGDGRFASFDRHAASDTSPEESSCCGSSFEKEASELSVSKLAALSSVSLTGDMRAAVV